MPTDDPTHHVPTAFEVIGDRLRRWYEPLGQYVDVALDFEGGSAGSVWRAGSGAPSDSLGANGDFYLDSANGDVYRKALDVYTFQTNLHGADGADGSDGTDGADGATWRDGVGAPDDASGADGDYYLDHATGDVYKRAAGTFTVVGSIEGPQGDQGEPGDMGDQGDPGFDGSVWRSAAGAVSDIVGVDGDFYLDRSNGDVYFKSGGHYNVVANITGPQGDPGADGSDGADGAAGAPGAKGDTGDTGATGAKGDTGDTGAAGDDGAPGAPGADGADGDDGADGVSPVRKLLAEWSGTVVPTTGTTDGVAEVTKDSDGTSFSFTAARAVARLESPSVNDQTFVIETAAGGDVAFASPTTVATLTVPAGHHRVEVTGLSTVIASGDLLALAVTAGGAATPWSVEMIATA